MVTSYEYFTVPKLIGNCIYIFLWEGKSSMVMFPQRYPTPTPKAT